MCIRDRPQFNPPCYFTDGTLGSHIVSEESLRRSSTRYHKGRPHRVLVVGAGTHFLSAMSYYTIRVTNALAGRYPVALIPMRRLIPTFLYPGRLSLIHI